MKIAINSNTDGHYRQEKLNGRDHIVTNMVPIVGGTVMNSGLYPDAEVAKSFEQLNMLPAPDGHPKVAGHHVSAFHPLATNAHNIGGVIRNPTKEGRVVNVELWVDIEVANSSDGGKELLQRIEKKEKVGVSTGLTLKQRASNGVGEDGKDYTWEGAEFKFDHVAILLNEAAAGEHAGTELKFNEGELQVVQLNELAVSTLRGQLDRLISPEESADTFAWISEIFPDSKQFVYRVETRGGPDALFRRGYAVDSRDVVSLLDDKTEVFKKITFEPVGSANNNLETETMANKNAANAEEGKKPDSSAQGQGEGASKVNAANDVQSAMELLESKGFQVNKKDQAEKVDYLVGNFDRIKAMLEKEDAKLNEVRKEIIANSDFTEDDLKGQSEDFLLNLRKRCIPANYAGLNGADTSARNAEGDSNPGGYGADAFEANKEKEAS